MTISMLITIVLVTLPYAFIGYFLFYRSEKVYDLRRKILQSDFETNMDTIFAGGYKLVNNYEKLPSYWKMVFSFKSIKKESWIENNNKDFVF